MCDDGGFDGFDWEDIALAGALAEECPKAERSLNASERRWRRSRIRMRDRMNIR